MSMLSLDRFTPAAFAAGDFMTESPSFIIHIPEGDLMARLLLLPPRNQIVFDAGSFTALELESSNSLSGPGRRSPLKHAPPMLAEAGQVHVELKTTDSEETCKRIADAVHLLRQWGRSHSSSKVA
jgi:hypothetical protein